MAVLEREGMLATCMCLHFVIKVVMSCLRTYIHMYIGTCVRIAILECQEGLENRCLMW